MLICNKTLVSFVKIKQDKTKVRIYFLRALLKINKKIKKKGRYGRNIFTDKSFC